ncbi:MAG TPA: hypothetical protein PK402_05940 [Tepidisphaeraceae bacterium]|nr:hypothetical protein [Tepidisphaeraceae bacterium]
MKLTIASLLSITALMTGCASAPTSESESINNVVQLTSGYSRAGEAYLSNDQKWLIFQAANQGQSSYDMYLAQMIWQGEMLKGIGRPIQISPSGSANTCGYFSPDSKSLIFASTGLNRPNQKTGGYNRQGKTYKWDIDNNLEIYRADGWHGAVAAADPRSGTNLAAYALTQNQAYDAECAFSADGKWIVFASNRDKITDDTTGIDLYVMKADGTSISRLTNTPGYDGGPFFSPDGRKIVYRSDRAGNDMLQVFVADLAFDSKGNITGITNEKQMTNDNAVNWGPYWYNNSTLAYATSLYGHDNYELMLSRIDIDRRCRITFTPGFDGLPVFSADGKLLIWSSKRTKDGTTQVFAAEFRLPAFIR